MLRRAVSGVVSLVLDVFDGSMENAAAVIQFGFHGKENQRWKIEEVK